ncbi:hypothetical protein [Clostridium sp. FP1]|uniref:hypothetical protein n=1 Tax=Clostridium sp. FP1 TaxID=2724076 RepID=UPI0013E9897C|nr:hypothetical protein [Clostridium sp. FP1]MBZ9637656.1 hypothetical protein [Clostridium sp. FP1]
MLLKLRKAGVQIFIATHDYNYAKYFYIKSAPGDKLKFYSFFKDDNNAVNYVESSDYSMYPITQIDYTCNELQ